MSSNRKRTGPTDSTKPVLATGTANNASLPPQRPSKSLTKGVQPPFANTSLSTFIYILVGCAALYLGAQSLNIASWNILGKSDVSATAKAATEGKDAIKDRILSHAHSKAGSGTGTVVGGARATGAGTLTIEQRINDLAEALGMPSGDLASAIAIAVREFVPPASLSSISAQAKETAHGGVVDELLGESSSASSASAAAKETQGGGGVGGIVGSLVGMDEPPTEDA